jgi:hypothetical protein
MNIFVTYLCPVESAKALDDKRVVKMILESAQMLSTAINLSNMSQAPYKSTHVNHPCSVWARTSKANFRWLLTHFLALCHEYTARYGKEHKCQQFYTYFCTCIRFMPDGELTPFANCTNRKQFDVITAYRLTMEEKWANDKRKPTWKNGSKPTW